MGESFARPPPSSIKTNGGGCGGEVVVGSHGGGRGKETSHIKSSQSGKPPFPAPLLRSFLPFPFLPSPSASPSLLPGRNPSFVHSPFHSSFRFYPCFFNHPSPPPSFLISPNIDAVITCLPVPERARQRTPCLKQNRHRQPLSFLLPPASQPSSGSSVRSFGGSIPSTVTQSPTAPTNKPTTGRCPPAACWIFSSSSSTQVHHLCAPSPTRITSEPVTQVAQPSLSSCLVCPTRRP